MCLYWIISIAILSSVRIKLRKRMEMFVFLFFIERTSCFCLTFIVHFIDRTDGLVSSQFYYTAYKIGVCLKKEAGVRRDEAHFNLPVNTRWYDLKKHVLNSTRAYCDRLTCRTIFSGRFASLGAVENKRRSRGFVCMNAWFASRSQS